LKDLLIGRTVVHIAMLAMVVILAIFTVARERR
jgi:hypothetical protein